jgi:hypothetical protein
MGELMNDVTAFKDIPTTTSVPSRNAEASRRSCSTA